MLAKAKELRLDYIFFGARDGFIMDEISKLIRSEIPEFPPTLYFYTSRAATVLAGIDSDEDILYASHIAFAGPIDEMLKTRFMLTDVEILKRGKCSDDEYVLKHKVAIMKRAKTARNNYLRYIEDLPIKKDSRIGFFDFVSSGTSQKGLSRIAGYDLYGLYFSQIYDSDKKDLKIDPMFGVHCAFEKSYHLIENFFFWENIFTSYEPTLKSFDELGQPVFMVENRTAKQFASLKEIHSGILDYVSEMKNNICHFSEVDKALPDHIYQMLQNDFSIISTDYYATEALEDAFCNRTFVIGED